MNECFHSLDNQHLLGVCRGLRLDPDQVLLTTDTDLLGHTGDFSKCQEEFLAEELYEVGEGFLEGEERRR